VNANASRNNYGFFSSLGGGLGATIGGLTGGLL